MNGIQLKPMPRYKRTDFEEDETSSTSSMPAAADVLMQGEAAANQQPPGARRQNSTLSPQVRYGPQGRKRNFWQRASPLERLLMVLVLILLFIISILAIILDVRSGNLRIVHLTTTNSSPLTSQETQFCLTPACITVASAIINAMDNSTDPCTDFYSYSCGGWIKSNPLPDGKSVWGTFGKLWQENQLVMKNVLEDTSITLNSEAENQARIFYFSCLDKNETMEKLGGAPLQDLIIKIGGWNVTGETDNWTLQSALETLHNTYNRGGLFTWAVGEDKKNSSRNIIQLDQGGLGLPTRDFYLNKSDDDEILNAYLIYMTRVGVLLGGEENATREQMQQVIEFEKELAEITIPADERLDDEKLYHKMTLADLQNLSPVIDWKSYFNSAFKQIKKDINMSEEMVIYAPDYLKNMSELVTKYLSNSQKKAVLQNYLGWSLSQSLVSCLAKPFRDASKVLRKALIGSEGGESPWRYCVSDTNNVIGFAMGAMFARAVFKGESKIMAEGMINEVREAFKDNLPLLDWMDNETRQLAKDKADSITDMIGFPDFIMNPVELDKKYDGLNFSESEYFMNNIRVNQFGLIKNMRNLYKAPNKTEWEMTPPTVNAYYTPTKNNIVFPAGILQAPFYDPNYPKSLNFGAMGVVMGHELTHAFDDEGREYDKEGNLHKWWKNSTIEKFQEQTKCFVDQYSAFEVNGEHLNGRQTLGENIADNGGLKAAFHAYLSYMKNHPAELILPGVNLTHRQLFFIGFSQVWCSTSTPEATHLQILNDPHSIAKFRVSGTLANSVDFAREFKCPKGTPMNPEKKCEVW